MAIGDQLRDHRGLPISGVSLPPESIPQETDIAYGDFSGGLNLAVSPETVAPNQASYALDVELTRDNRLVQAPGVRFSEDATPRKFTHLFPQASIDYTTELVAIDPPYLGVKSVAGFNWYNIGLAASTEFGWAAVNVLGELLFSNGLDHTYLRAAGAAVVTDVSAQIIARSFAAAFGRVFAGGYVSGGVYQALGIAWNQDDGNPAGWTGLGAGSELLLEDNTRSDRFVALRPIGQDFLGILNRNSLWVGVPTGQRDRPADFRERFNGIGAVNRRTVQSTPGGVTFLSDSGVANFDANSFGIISNEINAALLPLDYSRLNLYNAWYLPVLQRYILCTPSDTWLYEFPIAEVRPGRWLRRSLIADNLVGFVDQSGVLGWDTFTGSWDTQTLPWSGLVQSQSDAPQRMYFAQGSTLGYESGVTNTNFGLDPSQPNNGVLQPTWRTGQASKAKVSDIFETHAVEIKYANYGGGGVRLVFPDTDGALTQDLSADLPDTNGELRSGIIHGVFTGKGAMVQIEDLGNSQIVQIRQIVQPAGPASTALTKP